MNESDAEDFFIESADEELPMCGRALPCWCRGRERAPLESLPMFQYLKAQYEAEGHSSVVTPASVERGMGRGMLLRHSVNSADLFSFEVGTGSSSDTDNDMNIVQRYHRNQRPFNLPALMQRSDQSTRVTLRDPPRFMSPAPRPPAPKPPAPKPQEVWHSKNTGASKHCIDSNWKAERSNTKLPTTGGSQAQRKMAAAKKAWVQTKKRSFDPAEFASVGGLEWGLSWPNSRNMSGGRFESSEEEDEDSEQSYKGHATVAQKLALAEELYDVVKPGTREGSVSSLSECLTAEEVVPEVSSVCTFEVTDLPKSVTEECIYKIFSPFSEVSSVVLTFGPAGVTARVTMSEACNVAWIKECFEETPPFGVGTRPLKIKIFEDREDQDREDQDQEDQDL